MKKYLGIFTLLISVSSVLQWCSLPIKNTFIWWAINTVILFGYYKIWDKKLFNIQILNIFMLLVLSSAIYGLLYQAEIYWDYKLLYSNLMVFMLPLASYAYMNPSLLPVTLKTYIKYSPFLLLFLAPFLASDAFGRLLVPYSFLSLFFVLLNRKYKLMVLAAFVITLYYGYDSRSDVLKFGLCIVLGICFYFERVSLFLSKFLKFGRYLFLLTPFVFFTLAFTGVFNIFDIDEELGYEGKYSMGVDKNGNDISALADTRTFLYIEEIQSAVTNNYVIQGNSIARGYYSPSFGFAIDKLRGTNRGERDSNEVSILNIFNYFGLVGCIVYFFIFIFATYFAIYKSRNRYIPIIGLYVAFRWTFAWIEDFSVFDLNYMFLWIMIGLCFSPLYRNMTDEDFKLWVKSIN